MGVPDLLSELISGEDERAEAAVAKMAAMGAQVLPALRELFASSEAEARWWAVRALAEIPDDQVVPILVHALDDADSSVRWCAALALRQHPTPNAIPALLRLLVGEDSLAARLAGDALSACGKEAVPALLKLLENNPQAVRLEAIRVLSKIGDERSISTLFAVLDEESALMEYWASEGLERMGVGMVFFNP